MSDILTKEITRASQVVTLLGAAGFPVSRVDVSRSNGIAVHLADGMRGMSAWRALEVADMAPVRMYHYPSSVQPFSVAEGSYKGIPVRVFGGFEPEREGATAA